MERLSTTKLVLIVITPWVATETAHVAIVSFGTHGTNPSGSAYANMPSFATKYSRVEIEKVVKYIRTMTPKGTEYEVQGEP